MSRNSGVAVATVSLPATGLNRIVLKSRNRPWRILLNRQLLLFSVHAEVEVREFGGP